MREMENGIDTPTIRVERQLARKARIIAAVSKPAIPALGGDAGNRAP